MSRLPRGRGVIARAVNDGIDRNVNPRCAVLGPIGVQRISRIRWHSLHAIGVGRRMKTGVGMLGWSVGGDGDLDREANINGMEMGIGKGGGGEDGNAAREETKAKREEGGDDLRVVSSREATREVATAHTEAPAEASGQVGQQRPEQAQGRCGRHETKVETVCVRDLDCGARTGRR